jgi:hypothetical protein
MQKSCIISMFWTLSQLVFSTHGEYLHSYMVKCYIHTIGIIYYLWFSENTGLHGKHLSFSRHKIIAKRQLYISSLPKYIGHRIHEKTSIVLEHRNISGLWKIPCNVIVFIIFYYMFTQTHKCTSEYCEWCAETMADVVGHLPNKLEAPSSNQRTSKIKKR